MAEDRPEGGFSEGNEVLRSLQALAVRLGIEVRIEPFDLRLVGKGGLCRIGGRQVILVDAKLALLEQVGVIGEALGRAIPKGFEIPDRLAPYVKTGHAQVGRLLRPRPLARIR